jgi:hypothetical protein
VEDSNGGLHVVLVEEDDRGRRSFSHRRGMVELGRTVAGPKRRERWASGGEKERARGERWPGLEGLGFVLKKTLSLFFSKLFCKLVLK